MLPNLIRRLVLLLAPLLLLHLLRKSEGGKTKNRSFKPRLDKEKIVEGEIVGNG